ncbi:MAG: branched-chain amino acid ABC transporter permease [Desulfarculus sp.]|jgi:branched-chain amino acid transport system permease protein|nr:MAG: branched-chain amino acid ABC transporter permease [Desulfarculus sp.]
MEIIILGATRGALYSVIAVGFVLVFSVGGILNLAHGTYYMLGAYMTYIFYSLVFQGSSTAWLLLSIICAIGVVALFSCLVYSILLRKHVESLTYVMVMTLALALFVSEIMALLFGVSGSSVPSLIEGSASILSVKVLNQQLLLLPMALVILPSLWFFLKKTRMGQGIDAVAQQRDGAILMGVNADRALIVTYGLSASMAATAGVMVAPISSVVPEMWLFPLIKAFAIAILGGMGSILGAVIASFLLGYAEVFTCFMFSEHLSEMVALVLIVLVLVFRPSGILGKKDRMNR